MNRNQAVGVLPGIHFWNKNAPRIEMINAGDFHRDRLLDVLGLSKNPLSDSFGITDTKEICKRQEMIKFLMKNDELRRYLKEFSFWGSEFIPKDGQKFIDYFTESKSQFWQTIGESLGYFSRAEMLKKPKVLNDFVSFLKDNKSKAKAYENAFSKDVIAELKKASFMNGVLTFSTGIFSNIDLEEYEIFGYKKYAFDYKVKPPKWTQSGLMRSLRIAPLFQWVYKKMSEERKKLEHTHSIISDLPIELQEAVETFIESLLEKGKGGSIKSGTLLKFFFDYSSKGLSLWLVQYNIKNVSSEKIRTLGQVGVHPTTNQFPGYSGAVATKMFKGVKSIAQEMHQEIHWTKDLGILYEKVVDSGLLNSPGVIIESPELDLKYRAYALKHILESQFSEQLQAIEQYRSYIYERFETLKHMANIAEAMICAQKEWGLPISFPRILKDGEHLFSFSELHPIHLTDSMESDKLVAIKNLPPLNGSPLGLTGQNSGGKTVAMETMINMIFCAQSGLPVFGKNVSLNTKEVLGLVFVERGKSSTLALYIEKVLKVLKAVKETNKKNLIVFVDELGSATQEVSGKEFGTQILNKLFESHCSAVISTQILELAHYARENLKMECYKVNINHEFSFGIGDGGAMHLVEQLDTEGILS